MSGIPSFAADRLLHSRVQNQSYAIIVFHKRHCPAFLASPLCVLFRTNPDTECMLLSSPDKNESCSLVIEKLSHCQGKSPDAVTTAVLPSTCDGATQFPQGLFYYEITYYGHSRPLPTTCSCYESYEGVLCGGECYCLLFWCFRLLQSFTQGRWVCKATHALYFQIFNADHWGQTQHVA